MHGVAGGRDDSRGQMVEGVVPCYFEITAQKRPFSVRVSSNGALYRCCSMLRTTFELSVGGGHASAHLDLSRSPSQASRRALGIVALALVLPVLALLMSAALADATGNPSLSISRSDLLPEPLGLGLVVALPVAALALLAAARVRIAVGRAETGWSARVDVELAPVELTAALIGLLLLTFFVGHLIADGYACANGIRRAC